ncbi:MAG TPA: pyruvate kinase [Mesotoga infera]|jgi:pyruvate kinase|uniref:Pyruvate kinase n=1 Tax=Mesotoga infera TaxID=1236046 RepID=A0A7Z7LGG2_9BACT|nr:pyruvate kinase [Mesotoga infera]HRV00387.1 pyruvate kinase [Mesotoga sp.]SSC13436.1 Pyruvate kinase [Mesotoga infera]HNR78897.1 pyruvate kinase [Mesotoga infera]HNS66998.1 pyruvate kinase [Mesotoga infera]HOI34745.1 pyruvate kinase [Mesotoga infera]
MRKTKIVCTIGPATESWEMLTKLVFRGMNVARLNTTHGDLEEHRERIRRIKEVRNSLKVPLSLLLDLSGPKIRTGSFKKERVELLPGRDFLLTTSTIEGDETGVSVNYDRLPGEVKPGHVILMDDGKIKLKVLSTDERCILTKVINGGVVTHRRGINLPGIDISIPAVTEKDRGFIKLGIEEEVDYFALSFVRKAEDVILARQIVTDSRGSIPIISKIETAQALKSIEEIAAVSDGLMVARGDLGVEIPVEEVPIAQKKIIKFGNYHRIPVITATQMLESMIENPVPTRAETTDITNAIVDGSDAIMLSGETSIGKHPLEAVSVMDLTARAAEKYLNQNPDILRWTREKVLTDDHTDAICRAAWDISEALKVKVIVSSTFSGHTARNVSGFRPRAHILAVTPNEETYYKLGLIWGAHPVLMGLGESTDDLVKVAGPLAKKLKLVKKGDTIILTAGIPFGTSRSTNILKLEKA